MRFNREDRSYLNNSRSILTINSTITSYLSHQKITYLKIF